MTLLMRSVKSAGLTGRRLRATLKSATCLASSSKRRMMLLASWQPLGCTLISNWSNTANPTVSGWMQANALWSWRLCNSALPLPFSALSLSCKPCSTSCWVARRRKITRSYTDV